VVLTVGRQADLADSQPLLMEDVEQSTLRDLVANDQLGCGRPVLVSSDQLLDGLITEPAAKSVRWSVGRRGRSWPCGRCVEYPPCFDDVRSYGREPRVPL
jgi:hypothetical protein